MSLSPLLFDQVDVQLSGQMRRDRHQRRDHERHSAGRAATGSRESALVSGSGPGLQGSNITDRSAGSRRAGRVHVAQEAVRHQRRRRRADQAGQALVLLHLALLHERVLPGRAESTRKTRRRFAAPRTHRTRHSAARTPTTTTGASPGASTTSRSSPGGTRISTRWTRTGRSPQEPLHRRPCASRRGTRSCPRSSGPIRPRNRLLFEAGVAPGASPDTIIAEPDRINGHLHSGTGQSRRQHVGTQTADLSCAAGFRLRRPAPFAEASPHR